RGAGRESPRTVVRQGQQQTRRKPRGPGSQIASAYGILPVETETTARRNVALPAVAIRFVRFACTLAAVVACAALVGRSSRANAARRVSGNLVFWDQSRGFDTIA